MITDKADKINKIIMKYTKKLLILGFHSANLILIILYLYPASIFGCFLYNDCSIELQITSDFIITSNYLISSNHLYAFIMLSLLGVFAYPSSNKFKLLIGYLFSLSIILELFHLIISNREFEWGDFFGNILGVIFVIIIYKVKNRYA